MVPMLNLKKKVELLEFKASTKYNSSHGPLQLKICNVHSIKWVPGYTPWRHCLLDTIQIHNVSGINVIQWATNGSIFVIIQCIGIHPISSYTNDHIWNYSNWQLSIFVVLPAGQLMTSVWIKGGYSQIPDRIWYVTQIASTYVWQQLL